MVAVEKGAIRGVVTERGATRILVAGDSLFVGSRDDIPRTIKFLDGGHVDGALVFAPHRGDPLPTALKLMLVPIVPLSAPWTDQVAPALGPVSRLLPAPTGMMMLSGTAKSKSSHSS